MKKEEKQMQKLANKLSEVLIKALHGSTPYAPKYTPKPNFKSGK